MTTPIHFTLFIVRSLTHMANRYFLKVKEVIRETPDAVTIQFWHPISQEIRYQPDRKSVV